MKNFNIINKNGIKLTTANRYVDDDINVGLSKADKANLIPQNIRKDVTILGITGTNEGSISSDTSFNLAYGNTPPDDTSKIWLQCDKQKNINIQTTLDYHISESGKTLGSLNYENIDYSTNNDLSWPVSTCCYIDNNELLIIGQDFARIFNLETGTYTHNQILNMKESYNNTDYTMYRTGLTFSNCVYINGNVYFIGTQYFNINISSGVVASTYILKWYKYNTLNRELTEIKKYGTSSYNEQKENGYIQIPFIFLDSNILNCFIYENSYKDTNDDGIKDTKDDTPLYYIESYNIKEDGLLELNKVTEKNYGGKLTNSTGNYINYSSIKIGNYIYSFKGYDDSVILDLNSMQFATNIEFSSFLKSRLRHELNGAFPIYDGIHNIYIIGGRQSSNYNKIIKYDLITNKYEKLDISIGFYGRNYHFALLGDNRIWVFGGSLGYNNNPTRQDKIDYYDLISTLSQDSIAIVTENPLNESKNLYLINNENIKLNTDIASAYKINGNNKVEKVNIRYYERIVGKTTISSITFDKNIIASNFNNILNAIIANNDMISAMITNEANDSVILMLGNQPIDENNISAGYYIIAGYYYGDIMSMGVIDKDGNLIQGNESVPVTWLEGDTLTLQLEGEYWDAGVSSFNSVQSLIDLKACSIEGHTDITEFWRGINCENYNIPTNSN